MELDWFFLVELYAYHNSLPPSLSLVGSCMRALTSSIICLRSLMWVWAEALVLVVFDGFFKLVLVEAKAFEFLVAKGEFSSLFG